MSYTGQRTSLNNTSNNKSRSFPNGDTYNGGWRNSLPDGEGCYKWVDGSWYSGSWKRGRKHGLGTYVWPNGSRYHGEWDKGNMHGVGTFESPGGTKYQGSWVDNKKDGLGRKQYANGDVYEGLWETSRCHGPGRYKWRTAEYDGEWWDGKMHGQGTLKWSTGDRYDGEFKMGLEDGLGIATWKDGTYDGFWRQGRRHGLGVFRPAVPELRRTSVQILDSCAQDPEMRVGWANEEELTVHGSRIDGHVELPEADETDVAAGPSENPLPVPLRQRPASSESVPGGYCHLRRPVRASGEGVQLSEAMSMREYDDGQLLREEYLSPDELDALFGTGRHWNKRTESGRLLSRKASIERQGEKIYKGHRSYDLMLNLQLGMRVSIGRVNLEKTPKEITPEFFFTARKQAFPRDGSADTPPHPSADFVWKDYCPMAFRKLREIFNVDAAEFMTCICGDLALRELPSPGKSGSVFFLSNDDKYIIKTMRKGEVKLLQALLPKYLEHVQKFPHTLLIKFFGLYRVTPNQGAKVRFIVMNNLFQTSLPIHRKYDLKGSVLGRFNATPPGPKVILKDQNLDCRIKLEQGWNQRLQMQLEADCKLLEELRVMDYSLLLGIHHRSPEYNVPSSPHGTENDDDEFSVDTPMQSQRWSAEYDANGDRTPSTATTANGRHSDNLFSLSENGDALIAPTNELHHRPNAKQARELRAIKKQLSSKLGSSLTEQRLADLLKLAHFGMLTRERHTWRSPTMVLACRPKRSSTLRPVASSEATTHELTHRLGGLCVQLGLNMTATALPVRRQHPIPPAEDCVCYFGIIDILQDYNLSKRLEHRFKAIRHGADMISAVNPHAYSKRFQAFLKRIFM